MIIINVLLLCIVECCGQYYCAFFVVVLCEVWWDHMCVVLCIVCCVKGCMLLSSIVFVVNCYVLWTVTVSN